MWQCRRSATHYNFTEQHSRAHHTKCPDNIQSKGRWVLEQQDTWQHLNKVCSKDHQLPELPSLVTTKYATLKTSSAHSQRQHQELWDQRTCGGQQSLSKSTGIRLFNTRNHPEIQSENANAKDTKCWAPVTGCLVQQSRTTHQDHRDAERLYLFVPNHQQSNWSHATNALQDSQTAKDLGSKSLWFLLDQGVQWDPCHQRDWHELSHLKASPSLHAF